MKITIKHIHHFTGLLLMVILTAACEKNAKDEDFGSAKVYMPQATLEGLNYRVPQGNHESNYNYSITSNKVNIRLGVLRSGSVTYESYTADLAVNPDTVNTLISNGKLDVSTVLMPANMYSLPSSVTVPEGQGGEEFLLSLDKAMVKTYTGKKLALGVAIASTSKYTINQAINKVIVIVDVKALNLP